MAKHYKGGKKLTEKEKKSKPEELHKVESTEAQKARLHLNEMRVDALGVADVRKGIVSSSSVQQVRTQIQQTQTQQNQQTPQMQSKGKEKNQQ